MSKIDFYVVAGSGDAARQQFACRLAEKAYRHKNRVHIMLDNVTAARNLDELLWTFRDGSFVPHDLVEDGSVETDAPVTIGLSAAAHSEADLLINLTGAIPENVSAFPRVAEIVTSDEESKSRSRVHFASYRDAGHTLDTHKL